MIYIVNEYLEFLFNLASKILKVTIHLQLSSSSICIVYPDFNQFKFQASMDQKDLLMCYQES